MHKIFITGSTGFIGSHLVRRLVECGYMVSAMVRENSDKSEWGEIQKRVKCFTYRGDLMELCDFLKEDKPDVIIHTAAFFCAEHRLEQIDRLLKSNIELSLYLFEAMEQADIKKIIYTSTSWEHYQNEDYNPVCLYAATKKAALDLLRYYVESKGWKAITLTIYDTYGEDDMRGKVLSLFRKIAGKEDVFPMSYGEQKLDFVEIEDVTKAYIRAIKLLMMQKEKYKEYQVRSEKPRSLKEIAKIYETIHQTTLPIEWGKRDYRKREVMEVYTGGETLPEWNITIPLEEGLKKMAPY